MWVTVLLLSTLTPAIPRLDLKGTVQDEAGKGVPDAAVFIYTAGPRKGVSPICPSCYVDCWRRTRSDADGRFVFEQVDGSLVFRVGAVTPAHEPSFAAKVDPEAGDARITLRSRPPVPESPRRFLRGRVVDLDGKAVAHAVITPKGWTKHNGNTTTETYSSNPRGMPPLTLSGEDGRFLLIGSQEVDGLALEVEARGLATARFRNVPTGVEERPLAVGPGCAVRGRVLKDGRPVSDATVGIVQKYRGTETFVGERTAVTNSEGRFVFTGVVPDDSFFVYSKMQDFGPYGAVPIQDVKTTGHDTIVDLGDLAVAGGSRLTGRVVLPDGQKVPPDATISIHRKDAWDFVVVPLPDDGRFAVEGLPHEPLGILLGVAGYELSAKNELPIERRKLLLPAFGGAREVAVLVEPSSP